MFRVKCNQNAINCPTEENSNSFNLNFDISTAIKGVSVCLMMFHHFFGFPLWLESGINYMGIPLGEATLEYYIAVFGKICIAIYSFLSGYGLYASFSKKTKLFDFKYLVGKSIILLINWYLVLFLLQIPVMVLTGNYSGIADIFYNLTLLKFVGNPFIWYLSFYLLALWTFPLLFKIISKCKFNTYIFIIMPFVGIVVRNMLICYVTEDSLIYEYVLYILPMIAGMITRRERYYDKLLTIVKKIRLYKLAMIIVLIALIVLRQVLQTKALSFDCYFGTIFVFAIAVLFQDSTHCMPFFKRIGKYSTNLWYSHAILLFNGALIQKVLYAPKFPVLILGWGILLCVPGAIVIDFIINEFKKFFIDKVL